MSLELSKARRQLNEIKSLVKQDRLLPAVQFLNSGLNVVIRSSLIKNERTELEDLIKGAVSWISDNRKIREKFPLAIEYTPGEERILYETTQQLLEILQGEVQEQAAESIKLQEQQLKRKEERRVKMLSEADDFLAKGEVEQASQLHGKVTKEFGESHETLATIGEQYLNYQYYEEAFEYLSKALTANPKAIHLYNRVAIALRKMERYETAEKYYKKALEMAGKDVGLLFNLGRLYVEWKHWAKGEQAARLIVKIDPDFEEGKKLLAYIIKKQEEAAVKNLDDKYSENIGM